MPIWLVLALPALATIVTIFLYRFAQIVNYGIDFDIDIDDVLVQSNARSQHSEDSDGT